MPTDRVLILIETILNATGIEKAKLGLKGLNATTVALTLGIGALVVIGQQAITNARKQDDAWGQLDQAYTSAGDSLANHKDEIVNFIGTNKKFISDQYDTETAMAAVIRAGFNTDDMLRITGDALDIAAVKHISVSDAIQIVIGSLIGNRNNLKNLGVSQEDYDKIQKNKTLTTAQKHAAMLDLLEGKYKKGKESLDNVKQSQNDVNNEWERFTAKLGPPALTVWGDLNAAAATAVGFLNEDFDLLNNITKMDPGNLWKIVQMLNFINDPVGAARTIMDLNKGGGGGGGGAPRIAATTAAFGKGGRAAGGPVSAGEAYTVGERGPETLVMGSQSGRIVPNGVGNTHIHVHIDRGAFIDGPAIDMLTNKIAQRLRFVRGY